MKKIFLGVVLSVTVVFAISSSSMGGGSSSNTLIVDNTPTSSWFGDQNCENEESKYETIQDAVDDAQDGDTIEICSGTYSENINVTKKNLTIKGVDGQAIDDVVLDGGSDIAITIKKENETFDNFKIKSDSNGIYGNSDGKGSHTFENLIIEAGSRGIYLKDGDKQTYKNLTITSGDIGIYTEYNVNGDHTFDDLNISSSGNAIQIAKGGKSFTNLILNSQGRGIDVADTPNDLNFSSISIESENEGIYTRYNAGGKKNFSDINISAGGDGLNIDGGGKITCDTLDINSSSSRGIYISANPTGEHTFNNIKIISKNESIYVGKGGKSFTNLELNSSNSRGLDIEDTNSTLDIKHISVESKNEGLILKYNASGDKTLKDINITSGGTCIYVAKGFSSLSDANLTSSGGRGIEEAVYRDTSIDKVEIVSKDIGISFGWGNDDGSDINITHSSITSTDPADGINVAHANHFTVDSVCIKKAKNGIYIPWDVGNVVIKNSKINNTTDYAINLNADPSTPAKINNNCLNGVKLAYSNDIAHNFDGNYWDGVSDTDGDGKITHADAPNKIFDYVVDNSPNWTCKATGCSGGTTMLKSVIDYYMDECSWDNDSNTYEIKNFGTLGNDYNASAINNANTIDDGKIYRGGDINSSSADDKAILAKTDYSLPNKYTLTTWIKFPLNTDGHKRFGKKSDKKEYFNIADRVGSDNDFIYFTHKINDDSWSLSVKDDDQTKTIDFNPQNLSGWHMLTFVVTDNGTDFYLDKDENHNFSTHPNTGKLGLLFNSDYKSNNDNNVNGQSIGADVDEFQIFDKVLDSTQIGDIYDYDGSDRDAPQCDGGTQPPIRNYQFDARDTFRDKDDRNISTEIVKRTFKLTLMSLDKNNNEQDFNGTVCSRVESTDGYFGDYNKTIWSDDKEKNASFVVDRAIGGDINATLYIKWFKDDSDANCSSDQDTNDTNATDEFAIRPKDFNISDYPATIYAGEDFKISFEALNNNDVNATDYNESKSNNSFIIEYNEIKARCITGTLNLADFNFTNGSALNVNASYSEVGNVNITIKDSNDSHSFAHVDSDDTNDSMRLIESNTTQIHVQPYELNITNLNFTVSTGGADWLYMADSINDMNITLSPTLKAFNKQGNVLQDFNSTCYAKDVNVTFSYDINSSAYDVNLTLDGNLTDISDVNISDINKTLQIPKELFISGEANSSYAFGIDRSYNISKNPKNVKLKEANVTTADISEYQGGKIVDKNATFYYGRTYTQDLATSKQDDNTTVEILVYDNNATNGFVSGFKEELLDWYLNKKHTDNKFGDINDSVPSKSTQKTQTTEISTSIGSIDNGVSTVEVNTTSNTEGTYFIHLGEDRWLWYVPKNFGSDYNYTNGSDCSEHPCIKYNYKNNSSKNRVKSGSTTGVHFHVDVSNNNQGVRLLR